MLWKTSKATRRREKVKEEAGKTKHLLQRVCEKTESKDEAISRTLKIRRTP